MQPQAARACAGTVTTYDVGVKLGHRYPSTAMQLQRTLRPHLCSPCGAVSCRYAPTSFVNSTATSTESCSVQRRA